MCDICEGVLLLVVIGDRRGPSQAQCQFSGTDQRISCAVRILVPRVGRADLDAAGEHSLDLIDLVEELLAREVPAVQRLRADRHGVDLVLVLREAPLSEDEVTTLGPRVSSRVSSIREEILRTRLKDSKETVQKIASNAIQKVLGVLPPEDDVNGIKVGIIPQPELARAVAKCEV